MVTALADLAVCVALVYGVHVDALLGASRSRAVVAVRRALVRDLHEAGCSQVAIGRAIGRSHTSVAYLLRTQSTRERSPGRAGVSSHLCVRSCK